jgi:hypothetical protein
MKPSNSSPTAGAEAVVQAWDREEPEQAGILSVENIKLLTGTRN